MKSLNALQPLALLLLRAAFGIIFMSHGYPMLAHRTSATQTLFAQHGIPGYFVYISGVIELFGGGLLLLGLFTRGAGLLLSIEMVLLMWKVYTPHSYFAVNEYAYPLVLATGCFALATTGAGLASVDYPLFESGGGKLRTPRNAKANK
ncbi:MAG TPA: DoxX family protein [Candidatus Acidoferrum sp.]|nr:DoxX family protein [Candidatus Acidoferrum sp.]